MERGHSPIAGNDRIAPVFHSPHLAVFVGIFAAGSFIPANCLPIRRGDAGCRAGSPRGTGQGRTFPRFSAGVTSSASGVGGSGISRGETPVGLRGDEFQRGAVPSAVVGGRLRHWRKGRKGRNE